MSLIENLLEELKKTNTFFNKYLFVSNICNFLLSKTSQLSKRLFLGNLNTSSHCLKATKPGSERKRKLHFTRGFVPPFTPVHGNLMTGHGSKFRYFWLTSEKPLFLRPCIIIKIPIFPSVFFFALAMGKCLLLAVSRPQHRIKGASNISLDVQLFRSNMEMIWERRRRVYQEKVVTSFYFIFIFFSFTFFFPLLHAKL